MTSNCSKKPVVLVVLDGFGYSNEHSYNAIYTANKPNIDKWLKKYPNTLLNASGQYVGLFPGCIGNSEVGHCTIGCGRVIKQPLVVISEAINDGYFFENKVLLEGLEKVKNATGSLHLMGLLSDGCVHSDIEYLYAFLLEAKKQGIKNVYIHAFLDGRDVGPKTAGKYLADLNNFMKKNNIGVLASIHGRFYAMDRDKNWDRTEKTYKVLVGDAENSFNSIFNGKNINLNWESIINSSYAKNITDEFIFPVNILPKGQGVIKNGDGVIFFNFRPDRAKQITKCLLGQKNDVFEVRNIGLSCFVTPVEYGKSLETEVMFKHSDVNNTLKSILASNGKTIFSIAETEKYAHVTYFFDGGVNIEHEGEEKVLIKSKIMQSYASCSKMSADKITEAVIDSLNNDPKDFYLINYANADMVGHSGDFVATVKAIEYLDKELKKLYDLVIEKLDGVMYITADHGKAEKMFDVSTDQPCTAHTTNLVPFIFIKRGLENSDLKLDLTELADIAPFILQNMAIVVPKEMKK